MVLWTAKTGGLTPRAFTRVFFFHRGLKVILFNKEELERGCGKEVALEEYDTRKGEMEIWTVI